LTAGIARLCALAWCGDGKLTVYGACNLVVVDQAEPGQPLPCQRHVDSDPGAAARGSIFSRRRHTGGLRTEPARPGGSKCDDDAPAFPSFLRNRSRMGANDDRQIAGGTSGGKEML
jgi:hypothetical protein